MRRKPSRPLPAELTPSPIPLLSRANPPAHCRHWPRCAPARSCAATCSSWPSRPSDRPECRVHARVPCGRRSCCRCRAVSAGRRSRCASSVSPDFWIGLGGGGAACGAGAAAAGVDAGGGAAGAGAGAAALALPKPSAERTLSNIPMKRSCCGRRRTLGRCAQRREALAGALCRIAVSSVLRYAGSVASRCKTLRTMRRTHRRTGEMA
jgi:hypothetical protein